MQTRRLQYIHMFHVELGDRGVRASCGSFVSCAVLFSTDNLEKGGVGGVSVRARTRSSASGLHGKGLCAKCGELREGADNNQVGFNSVIERY